MVGSQKPQFALFGDTVNTASRMMSTGEAVMGWCRIPELEKQKLPGHFGGIGPFKINQNHSDLVIFKLFNVDSIYIYIYIYLYVIDYNRNFKF